MDNKLRNFYKGKRVLITGHTGFKGAWLSLWLSRLGANVFGLALAPSGNFNLYDILGLHNKTIGVVADVRDKNVVQSFLNKSKPEIIFHMAAQSLVRASYDDPIATYETNVIGTANILESCRKSDSVRVIINVTSDKCYDNNGNNHPYRESDPLGGDDPYSSSKGCAELVSAAYLKSFFLQEKYQKDHQIALASVRAGNVVGGGDWNKDRLVPDCIKAILANEMLEIRYPNAIRPWQYVLDVLYGYILLAMRLYEDGSEFSGPWNFGPKKENEQMVSWIVQRIQELWDNKLVWKVNTKTQPYESMYLRLDSTKARSCLGWHQQYELLATLRETVCWYKAWQNKLDMEKYSLNQIESYMQDIDK